MKNTLNIKLSAKLSFVIFAALQELAGLSPIEEINTDDQNKNTKKEIKGKIEAKFGGPVTVTFALILDSQRSL